MRSEELPILFLSLFHPRLDKSDFCVGSIDLLTVGSRGNDLRFNLADVALPSTHLLFIVGFLANHALDFFFDMPLLDLSLLQFLPLFP